MLEVGASVVVRTPDHRTYYGRLIEIRGDKGNAQFVVRLDSGWVTAYPAHMVELLESDKSSDPDL